jgi:hypothetical protein
VKRMDFREKPRREGKTNISNSLLHIPILPLQNNQLSKFVLPDILLYFHMYSTNMASVCMIMEGTKRGKERLSKGQLSLTFHFLLT